MAAAEKTLRLTASKAKRKFSRTKAERVTARIKVKWKSKSGKWVYKNYAYVSYDFEQAIENLLLNNPEIATTEYETKEGYETIVQKIGGKTKQIVGVSFDKYRHGKLPQTSRKKKPAQKTRSLRHRK